MQVATYLKISVAVALATIALKTAAWSVTGSVSLLSDALEGLVNLAGAIFALAMVMVAALPADAEHPYGHHKAEYFSSGFEGVLIVVAAVAIVWTAVERVLHPQAIVNLGPGIALAIAASVLNGVLAWAMLKKAREADSIALEADARHLFTDVLTTAGVVTGLLTVRFTGWLWLDPLVAIGVALHILHAGWSLLRRSVDGLMDHALDAPTQARIEGVIRGFSGPEVRFDHLVTRKAGARLFVEMHLHLPALWTLERAAALRAEVEASLIAALPGLQASIQLLPEGVEPASPATTGPPP